VRWVTAVFQFQGHLPQLSISSLQLLLRGAQLCCTLFDTALQLYRQSAQPAVRLCQFLLQRTHRCLGFLQLLRQSVCVHSCGSLSSALFTTTPVASSLSSASARNNCRAMTVADVPARWRKSSHCHRGVTPSEWSPSVLLAPQGCSVTIGAGACGPSTPRGGP
jgi:hypothetical protein